MAYTNTIVVHHGATAADTTQALDQALASTTRPLLIKLEPGTYALDTAITLDHDVTVAGSGQALTILHGGGNQNSLGANCTLRDLTLTESHDLGGGGVVYLNTGTSELRNVTLEVAPNGANASAAAVYGQGTLDHVDVSATPTGGATVDQVVFVLPSGTMTIRDSRIAGPSEAIYARSASSEVRIENSQLIGSTHTLYLYNGAIAKVTGSEISHAVTTTGATCAFSYDASLAPLNASCQ